MKHDDPETIYKEPGVKGHLKRHAATYVSLPVAVPSMGISTLIGKTIDDIRAGKNAKRTHVDSLNPRSTAKKLPRESTARKGYAINGRLREDGQVAYVPFSRLSAGMINFDSRPRNGNGQYVANETGGADPNSMAAAYGGVAQDQKRKTGLLRRLMGMGAKPES